MNTLEFILQRYSVDPEKTTYTEPVKLKLSRWKELPALFKDLGFTVGAEIGVLKGEFTKVFCEQGIKMYGIDLWEPYETYKDFQGKEVFDNYYDIAHKTLSKYDCTLIKGWSGSKEVLDQIHDESLDFVFIDGNHAFEYVVEDVAKWSKKVRKGGIISGHDLFDGDHGDSYGVKQAIPAWCDAKKIKPWFALKGDKCPSWFFVKV